MEFFCSNDFGINYFRARICNPKMQRKFYERLVHSQLGLEKAVIWSIILMEIFYWK